MLHFSNRLSIHEFWFPSDKVYMIAEIGINHNGDLDLAKQLIVNSKKAGFDAVKFQKRTIDIVYSAEAGAAS